MNTTIQYIKSWIRQIPAIACGSLCLMTLAGCNKYLDTLPDDRAQITAIDEVNELITSGYPSKTYIKMFELRSDNAQDKGPVRSSDIYDEQMYEWKPVTSIYQDTPQAFWRDCYEGAAATNQAIDLLNNMGDNVPIDKKTEAIAEARMLRSYHLFMVAQAFTQPYDPKTAETDLGLPYPTEPEKVVFEHYKRGNLATLYKKIIEDFDAAYKDLNASYKVPKFHFTPIAASAYATRLYRVMGDWDKVISYGNKVLGSNLSTNLRKYNTDYPALTYDERKLRWGSISENTNLFISVSQSWWYINNYSSRYGLTPEIQKQLFNDNTFLGFPCGISLFGSTSKGTLNFPKFYKYFKVTNQSSGTGYGYTPTVLITGEEVLFNVAEAYVMKGEFDKANEYLQAFVANWFIGYNANLPKFQVTTEKIEQFYLNDQRVFTPFYPLTPKQLAYIKAITDMRRIAFIQEGLRWLDIRQYHLEVVHSRIDNNKNVQDPIIFKSGDPRIAFQLPSNVLGFDLQPNPGYEENK